MPQPTILIAPDSFKGSLSAPLAAAAIARGLQRAQPDARLVCLPLSDGGEGFVDALLRSGGGEFHEADTVDALGRPIRAAYARLAGGKTVAVELSSAAGLVQVPEPLRDPLVTSTYGVGQLIARAYAAQPFETLLLGLGGSATVDGGAGILEALGAQLLDAANRPVSRGGGGLAELDHIDLSGVSPVLRDVVIRVAADVDNPLLGPRGAAPVFAPQKGATPEDVVRLEKNLQRLADALEKATGRRVHELPGTGSAGGTPAGLVAIAAARIEPGFELIARAIDLDRYLIDSQWIVSGEGQLDQPSFEGKVVGRLARRAQAHGRPFVAIVGNIDPLGERLLDEIGGAVFSLVPGPLTREEAMRNAEAFLERAAFAVGRMILLQGTLR